MSKGDCDADRSKLTAADVWLECPSCQKGFWRRFYLRGGTAFKEESEMADLAGGMSDDPRDGGASVRPEQPHVLEEPVPISGKEAIAMAEASAERRKEEYRRVDAEEAAEDEAWVAERVAEAKEGAGLPTYSGIESVCAKCGSHGAAAVKYFAEDFKTASLNERIPEHLRRTCDICGYAWVEACKLPSEADAAGVMVPVKDVNHLTAAEHAALAESSARGTPMGQEETP